MSAAENSPAQLLWDSASPHLDALAGMCRELLLDGSRSAVAIDDVLRRLGTVLAKVTDDDIVDHPLIYLPLTDVDEAKRLFDYLHKQGLLFPPYARPREYLADKVTPEQVCQLQARMIEAEDVRWGEEGSEYEYYLKLTEENDT